MFCTYVSNLVILAWTADELSCGQASDWYTHTDRYTDRGDDNTRRPKLASGKKTSWDLFSLQVANDSSHKRFAMWNFFCIRLCPHNATIVLYGMLCRRTQGTILFTVVNTIHFLFQKSLWPSRNPNWTSNTEMAKWEIAYEPDTPTPSYTIPITLSTIAKLNLLQ